MSAAEGVFSQLGAVEGQDDLVEGERALCHKGFLVGSESGVLKDRAQATGGECVKKLTVRCLQGLPLCDAVGLLNDEDSTGLMIWDAGDLLIRSMLPLVRIAHTKPQRYIELGSGVGLASLALASASIGCTHITATDCNEEVLAALEQNVVLNDLRESICVRELTYGPVTCGGMADAFDVVFACDVIYSRSVVVPLVQTAAELLVGGGSFWLSYIPRTWGDDENRMILEELFGAASARGFRPPVTVAEQPVTAADGSETDLVNSVGGGERAEDTVDKEKISELTAAEARLRAERDRMQAEVQRLKLLAQTAANDLTQADGAKVEHAAQACTQDKIPEH
ncbi:Protein N-methyltransferase NNT1 [Diplonema papillatum]|nr:Protein N-methyltransferase NNT1 [Diplonema papillatum]